MLQPIMKVRERNWLAAQTKNSIHWIDILLQNGVVEDRKYVLSLILVPYFVNIKCLPDTDIFAKLKEWFS